MQTFNSSVPACKPSQGLASYPELDDGWQSPGCEEDVSTFVATGGDAAPVPETGEPVRDPVALTVAIRVVNLDPDRSCTTLGRIAICHFALCHNRHPYLS